MEKRIGTIHCSATPETSRLTFEQCKDMHSRDKSRGGKGWRDIGYNYYIEIDGSLHIGRQLGSSLAHAIGYNNGKEYIAICYEGGLDSNKKAKDTRTEAQKQTLIVLKLYLEKIFEMEWCGHRDLSPDKNHDGIITPDEWLKSCPCFDVETDLIFKT